MTNLLRVHQPLTARELAMRLCVSERTIYRYMDDLSLAGIPVYGEAGLGYRLSEGFEMAPLQLSAAELEALITGVNLVAVLTGKGMADPARSLLAKIEAALPAQGIQADRDPVVRVPDYRTAHPVYARWDQLHDAITAGRWLEIGYQDARASKTGRHIYPLGLFTGADAGRSAPGVRCVRPIGISGWIASIPWRRAVREKGHLLA